MAHSIMIDAGHGGSDPGAVYNGRQEKTDNLNLALATGEILQNKGFDVEYTRTTDEYISPYQRAVMANEAGVDYFVSFHRNSYPTDNEVSGVETLVYNLSGIKYEMAQNILDNLVAIGFKDLGVKARPNLVVLRRTRMPAVLIETGFINSDSDNALFDARFEDIAQTIADGIIETINGDDNSGSDGKIYSVQVGAFRNSAYATRLLNELAAEGFPAYIDSSGPYDRVKVGNYDTLQEAADMERQLKRAGYSTLVVS